jgi:uncharacterized protein (DUF427 family)
MQAIWKNQVIAESNDTIMIEGNHYFPPESVKREFLTSSDTQYHCPWKGDATYYNVVVNGETNPDAAWCYLKPLEGAFKLVGRDFSGWVAFWHGVEVK